MTGKNYFSRDELSCRHCGEYNFDETALSLYNVMREECGFPWVVTSAYRCSEHPVETNKQKPGAHNRGTAIDVLYKDDEQLLSILRTALNTGVTRVGINDKSKFIHLDFDRELKQPSFWTY